MNKTRASHYARAAAGAVILAAGVIVPGACAGGSAEPSQPVAAVATAQPPPSTTAAPPTTTADPCDPAVIEPMRAEAEAEHARRVEAERERHREKARDLGDELREANSRAAQALAISLALGGPSADKEVAEADRIEEALEAERGRHDDRMIEIEDWAYDLLQSPAGLLGRCPAPANDAVASDDGSTAGGEG